MTTKGYRYTQEQRRRMSKAKKKYYSNPEHRTEQSQRIKRFYLEHEGCHRPYKWTIAYYLLLEEEEAYSKTRNL